MQNDNTLGIMVLEDDTSIGAKIIEEFELFIQSDEIIWTKTLKESVECLKSNTFKIVVLDLNLPDGNGISVLDKIKKTNPDTLVYIFSIDSELEKMCLKRGATAFFDKSNNFCDLIITVKSALEN